MTSDPDQIRSGIEQTQRNLSADVDALTEKVSPPRIVERRVERTRSAVTTLKDRIMGSTAQQASTLGQQASNFGESAGSSAAAAKDTVAAKASSAADAASSVPGQVRQRAVGNPLAAGLIAFGAGWLLSALLPATEPEKQVASQVKDLAVEQGRPVVQQLGQAGQQAAEELRESAQQRVQSVKETASDAASTVTEEARSQASDVTGHAQEARTKVTGQSGLDGA
jgi:cell division septum initiation protein DivIVA